MTELGHKIKEARMLKGLSQETLADLSKVNLRTIQRIESNANQPHGKTLNLICEALDINIEDLVDYGKQADTSYLVYFHLSVLSFLVIPLGNILLPLILWLTKKDKIIDLNNIGINLLNYQIVWTVVSFVAILMFAFFKIMHYDYASLFLYAFIGLYVINIIMPVLFAIKSKNSKNLCLYPKPVNIIK
jgi:transcriptional regulator with XRE-family HTH domain